MTFLFSLFFLFKHLLDDSKAHPSLKTSRLRGTASIIINLGASLVAQLVKNLPAKQETWV